MTTSIKKTLKEYGRGIIGGLIFSLPLLYTMEIWWTGFIASPEKLLAFVAFTFVLLLGYNRFAGMREDASFLEICEDSVEEIGLGFIVTFLFLLLINRVGFTMSLEEILGKVIVESMVVAIGISVGTAQLGQKEENGSGEKGDGKEGKKEDDGEEDTRKDQKTEQQQDPDSEEKKKDQGEKDQGEDNGTKSGAGEKEKKEKSLVHVVVLSFCGAVLFASSVAPTEEILQIAVESQYLHLLLMVVVTLILSSIILFFSDFRNSSSPEAGIKEVALHVVVAYLAALIISYLLLWFFGRVGENSLEIIVAQTVVLAIPAAIGASAGRLLIGE